MGPLRTAERDRGHDGNGIGGRHAQEFAYLGFGVGHGSRCSYAGDDVQVRTLVTGQINPHNLAIHGVHWLSQPGWVDSGWRGSQVMGISEHFEQIFRLPSWVSTPYRWVRANRPTI